jgi:sugar-specific transcriptional regulator TrmB
MEFDDFLEELELSPYEKKAYACLLRIGVAKSKHVAKESGVSYGRIYEILEKLAEKGLISIIPTEPKTFIAIDPHVAFRLILRKREDRLQMLKHEILKMTFPTQEISKKSVEKTIVVQGKQKQLAIINEMHERAKKEILMIPGVYEPNVARNVATLRALKRHVRIKRLIRAITPKNKEILKESVNLGEEIKKAYLPGLRLIVADDKEAMISIVNPASKDRISIYTTNREFAKSMSTFFNSLWESSRKISVR